MIRVGAERTGETPILSTWRFDQVEALRRGFRRDPPQHVRAVVPHRERDPSVTYTSQRVSFTPSPHWVVWALLVQAGGTFLHVSWKTNSIHDGCWPRLRSTPAATARGWRGRRRFRSGRHAADTRGNPDAARSSAAHQINHVIGLEFGDQYG